MGENKFQKFDAVFGDDARVVQGDSDFATGFFRLNGRVVDRFFPRPPSRPPGFTEASTCVAHVVVFMFFCAHRVQTENCIQNRTR